MSHWHHLHRRTFLTAGALAVAGGFDPLPLGSAADAPPVTKVEPELAPKRDVGEKLRALKPNQAVLLGKADVVGEFNDAARKYDLHKTGPKGRDFTIKMCWAPERKRALFCGANHGVPHRLNDVWEFDLPSLTWAMLYAPDLPRGYGDFGKDTSDVEFKDGILITKRGGPAVQRPVLPLEDEVLPVEGVERGVVLEVEPVLEVERVARQHL